MKRNNRHKAEIKKINPHISEIEHTLKKDKSNVPGSSLKFWFIVFAVFILILILTGMIALFFSTIRMRPVANDKTRDISDDLKVPDPLLEKSPCKDFELIAGNLSTAKIILIGESHNSRNKTIDCLTSLTKDIGEHIVFVESMPLDQELECEINSIESKLGRTCVGWDDADFARTAILNGCYEYASQVTQVFKRDTEKFSITDDENDWRILGMIGQIKSFYKDRLQDLLADGLSFSGNYVLKEFEFIKIKFLFLHLKEIQDFRKAGKSYDAIFSEELQDMLAYDSSTETLDLTNENIINEEIKRNKSLLSAVGMFKDKKRFLIAGRAHLLPRRGMLDTEGQRYVYDELNRGKDSNPYAILALH